jgi:hypothetical protein
MNKCADGRENGRAEGQTGSHLNYCVKPLPSIPQTGTFFNVKIIVTTFKNQFFLKK